MKKIVIITGANRGFGEAIFNEFYNECNQNVIISMSRNCNLFQNELMKKKDSRFVHVPCELDKPDSINLIAMEKYLTKNNLEIVLFLNAASVSPVKAFNRINKEEITNSLNINVVSSVLILNTVINIVSSNRLTVVNLSSGAASKPISGWSLYCSAKSYLKLLIETLELENSNNDFLRFSNFDPGVMDTEMQQEIRSSNDDSFVRFEEFVELKKQGKLREPSEVVSVMRKSLNL
jgi:benzil reductase ((S)-benzoin forming)